MTQESEAKIVLRIETTQAERDLQRIRQSMGEGGGPAAGGEGGGGAAGGAAGAAAGARAGARGAGARGAAAAGGGGLGATIGKAAAPIVGLVAAATLLKDVFGDLKTVVEAATGPMSRGLSDMVGLSEKAAAAKAQETARAETMQALGPAGQYAPESDIIQHFTDRRRMHQEIYGGQLRTRQVMDRFIPEEGIIAAAQEALEGTSIMQATKVKRAMR